MPLNAHAKKAETSHVLAHNPSINLTQQPKRSQLLHCGVSKSLAIALVPGFGNSLLLGMFTFLILICSPPLSNSWASYLPPPSFLPSFLSSSQARNLSRFLCFASNSAMHGSQILNAHHIHFHLTWPFMSPQVMHGTGLTLFLDNKIRRWDWKHL